MAVNQGQETEWLANGFPPHSYPVETPHANNGATSAAGRGHPAPLPTSSASRSARSARGWWIAGAVGLVLVLIAAAAVLISRRGRDGNGASTGTTNATAAPETTLPPAATPTFPAEPSTSSNVTTQTTGASTTSATAGTLEISSTALTISKVDATTGPGETRLTLRDTGPVALNYTTQSSAAGLTATPAKGRIAAGGSAELTVSLDASKVSAEGPFSGTLSIGGTGGVRTVTVSSTAGRPPNVVDDVGEGCPAASATTCSRQIKLAATTTLDPSPCNTSWLYSVTITDQSQIQSAKSIARRGLANADTSLLSAGRTSGPSGVFQSPSFAPLPAGIVLRFMIEAVDQHGYTTRLAEQTITC